MLVFFKKKSLSFKLNYSLQLNYYPSLILFFSPFHQQTSKQKYPVNFLLSAQLPSETLSHDFVLPGCSVFEKKTSFFNYTGRLQESTRILSALGSSTPDWRLLIMLASFLSNSTEALGIRSRKVRPFSELEKLSPIFLARSKQPTSFRFKPTSFLRKFSFLVTPIQHHVDSSFISDTPSALSKTIVLLERKSSFANFL